MPPLIRPVSSKYHQGYERINLGRLVYDGRLLNMLAGTQGLVNDRTGF